MASQGPNSPTTSEDNGGAEPLGNATAATSENGSSVTFGPSGSAAASNYLKTTGFGFSIPTGATVDGILVEWKKACGTLDAGWTAKDSAVRIVKGDVIGSTDKSVSGNWPSATLAYVSHGGASDLWGETWSISDINASDFGAAISAVRGDGASVRQGIIDHCRITVYYTVAAGGMVHRRKTRRVSNLLRM